MHMCSTPGGTEVSGDSSEYDGSALASEHGVIVVTANYRFVATAKFNNRLKGLLRQAGTAGLSRE